MGSGYDAEAMAKPRIFVAMKLPSAGLDLLRERFAVDSGGNGSEDGAPLAQVHIGSATAATRDATARLVAGNLFSVIEAPESPATVV